MFQMRDINVFMSFLYLKSYMVVDLQSPSFFVHTLLMSFFFPSTMMVLVASKKSWGMGTCKSSRGGRKNDRQDGGGDQPGGFHRGPICTNARQRSSSCLPCAKRNKRCGHRSLDTNGRMNRVHLYI